MKNKIPAGKKIEVYFLGDINYNENGTSWTGLGADCRCIFYIPDIDVALLQNAEGEYCYIDGKNSRLGRKIKADYRVRAAEMLSIRPMTEDEKRPYQENYAKKIQEYEEKRRQNLVEMQQLEESLTKKESDWKTEQDLYKISTVKNSLSSIEKELEGLQRDKVHLEEAGTVYNSAKNELWFPTLSMRTYRKVKINKELILRFMKVYDEYLKSKKVIKRMDSQLKRTSLEKIVEIVYGRRESSYIPCMRDGALKTIK